MDDLRGSDGFYLKGKLLLAMPGMMDPRFDRSVIFLCAHDAVGSMGLVVNKKLENVKFKHVLEQVGMKSDICIDAGFLNIPVFNGGPVDSIRGFLLHSSDYKQPDTVEITESFRVTGTIEALKEVISGKGPEEMLFILGYAGWGAGQLEQEIQANSWLVAEAKPQVIFEDSADHKWAMALKSLGIDPAMLSSDTGRA